MSWIVKQKLAEVVSFRQLTREVNKNKQCSGTNDDNLKTIPEERFQQCFGLRIRCVIKRIAAQKGYFETDRSYWCESNYECTHLYRVFPGK
jgi:hypothetical protein